MISSVQKLNEFTIKYNYPTSSESTFSVLETHELLMRGWNTENMNLTFQIISPWDILKIFRTEINWKDFHIFSEPVPNILNRNGLLDFVLNVKTFDFTPSTNISMGILLIHFIIINKSN